MAHGFPNYLRHRRQYSATKLSAIDEFMHSREQSLRARTLSCHLVFFLEISGPPHWQCEEHHLAAQLALPPVAGIPPTEGDLARILSCRPCFVPARLAPVWRRSGAVCNTSPSISRHRRVRAGSCHICQVTLRRLIDSEPPVGAMSSGTCQWHPSAEITMLPWADWAHGGLADRLTHTGGRCTAPCNNRRAKPPVG